MDLKDAETTSLRAAPPASLPPQLPPLPEWPAVGERILDGATTYRERTYKVALGYRPLTLDLHVPDGTGPFPVAVYAHGGGFMLGTPVMGEWRMLLAMGIAVASIRYRLRDEAKHPEPLSDIVAAAGWVRAHAEEFGLDNGCVIGVGSSAGAYLVDTAALRFDVDGEPYASGATNLFSAVISFYAPTDFLALADDAPADVLEQPGGPSSTESLYLGYVPSSRPGDAAEAAIAANARSDAPPFLILHGDADTRVGVGQAYRLTRALHEAGACAELHILSGAQHGDPRFMTPESTAVVEAFLTAQLFDR